MTEPDTEAPHVVAPLEADPGLLFVGMKALEAARLSGWTESYALACAYKAMMELCLLREVTKQTMKAAVESAND